MKGLSVKVQNVIIRLFTNFFGKDSFGWTFDCEIWDMLLGNLEERKFTLEDLKIMFSATSDETHRIRGVLLRKAAPVYKMQFQKVHLNSWKFYKIYSYAF